MQRTLFLEMIVQNSTTSCYSFNNITDENKKYRLDADTASIGFTYRHIGKEMPGKTLI